MNLRSRSKLTFTILLYLCFSHLYSQANIAINKDGSLPDSSAILDITSTSQGLLIPRLTTEQRDLIAKPKTGLEIYNLDIDCFEYYNGTNWLTNCGFLNDPTMAMAGNNRSTILDTIHLAANSPKLSESGLWSILEGVGGNFSDVTDPDAIFSNNGNFMTFKLRWTISNPCGKTYSDVVVSFYKDGIYVSFIGSDAGGDGSPNSPYLTIQKGVDESTIQSKSDVFISEGTFEESLLLSAISAINITGGHYAYDWNISDHNLHVTRIQGPETACTIINCSDISISGIQISSKRNFIGHSTGLDIINSNNIVVIDCEIISSNAGRGIDGTPGQSGTSGSNGGDYNTPITCSSQTTFGGTPGSGGAFSVGGVILNGGNGGTGGQGDDDPSAGSNGISGSNGSPSGDSGGAFGTGIGPCNNGACSTGGVVYDGADGQVGTDGQHGIGGLGIAFASNGSEGSHGSGGGGGGGGGGCGLSTGTSCGNRAGNSGAGGGGGGSGASAGSGGSGGYNSLGIWAKNSSLEVQNSSIETGIAGDGGNGGKGEQGGIGGMGGFSEFFDFSFSGSGGDGGKGGDSGSGGGGGGGSSICILHDSASAVVNSGNTFDLGPPGQGGKSAGNEGQSGLSQNIVNY